MKAFALVSVLVGLLGVSYALTNEEMLRLLDERLVKGEISEETYKALRIKYGGESAPSEQKETVPPGKGEKNLVVNGSFEEADSRNPNMPAWWQTEDWNTAQGKPAYTWDDKVAHTGERSVLIECPSGSAGAWLKYLWKDKQPLLGDYFKADRFYQMSAWVKIENSAGGANIILDGCEIFGARPMVATYGTHDWKRLVIKGARLKAGTNVVGISLVCRGGKAWFDDVEIVAMQDISKQQTASETEPVSRPVPGAGSKNLVHNSGFEEMASETRPVDWNTEHYGGASASYSFDAQVRHSGKYSFRLEASEAGRNAIYPLPGGTKIKIREGRTYELRVWVKTKDLDYGPNWSDPLIRLSFFTPAKMEPGASLSLYNEMKGTNDWRQFVLKAKAPAGATEAFIDFVHTKGVIWLDDVEFVEVD